MKANGLRGFGILAVIAAAVLVPLYGNPYRSPVSHPEWARMMLRGLHMESFLPTPLQASQAFSILSWRNTLEYPASRYVRADGIDVKTVDGVAVVVATAAAPGEVGYPVSILRGGNYELRLRGRGTQAFPAEITRSGETKPAGTFSAVPSPDGGWVGAGKAHLDPGGYVVSVAIPQGVALESLEVVPPCVEAVEPPGGWHAPAIAQTTDVAVTTLKALDQESVLPPAASPVEVAGTDFQEIDHPATNVAFRQAGTAAGAGPGGLRLIAYVDLPEAGLYTVSVLGSEGGGQSWLSDSCQKAVLCPSRQASSSVGWRVLQTAAFSAGRHFLNVTLGPGAAIGRLRFEKKKDGPEDYIDALRRLGLELGPPGPVSREKAIEAMKFIEAKSATLLGQGCGDDLAQPTATLVAQGGGLPGPAAPEAGPGVTPPSAGRGPTPLTPPAVPPQIPASPVTP